MRVAPEAVLRAEAVVLPWEGVGVRVGRGEALRLLLALPARLAEPVALPLGLSVRLRVGRAERVTLGVVLLVRVEPAEGVSLLLTLAVALRLALSEAAVEGDTEALLLWLSWLCVERALTVTGVREPDLEERPEGVALLLALGETLRLALPLPELLPEGGAVQLLLGLSRLGVEREEGVAEKLMPVPLDSAERLGLRLARGVVVELRLVRAEGVKGVRVALKVGLAEREEEAEEVGGSEGRIPRLRLSAG